MWVEFVEEYNFVVFGRSVGRSVGRSGCGLLVRESGPHAIAPSIDALEGEREVLGEAREVKLLLLDGLHEGLLVVAVRPVHLAPPRLHDTARGRRLSAEDHGEVVRQVPV